jgi:glycosyltransferase involved in cell wall biosynthesis
VIPLYNKQAHVGDTLASIAAQSHPPLEVIVVNDGSTDESVAVVRRANLPGLRLIEQANAGAGAARNRGVAEANGEWIAFVDADDLWLADHLATLAGLVRAYPEADVVSAGYVRATRAAAAAAASVRRPCAPLGLVDFFAEQERVCASTIAVRATTLRACGGFTTRFPGEDLELWTRLALDHRFAIQPYVTAIYVQETGGAMDSQLVANEHAIDDPALDTIDRALADERYRHRWPELRRFRRHLLKAYSRGALFHGRTRVARAYLAALREQGGSAPLAYRLLARLPSPMLRSGMRLYSRVKRLVRGSAAAG